MLDAGVSYIDQNGLTVGFRHLPLEEIIAAAQVPRATVYRQWPSQEAYVADLLAELFERPEFALGFSAATTESLTAALQQHQSLLGTPRGRKAVMRELIRVAAETNYRELPASTAWQAYEALHLAAAHNSDPTLSETARRIEQRFIDFNTGLYQKALDTLGLRPKPPHTAHSVAVAAHLVVTGIVSRRRVEPGIDDFTFDGPAVDGTTVQWHLAAHLARHAIEPLVEDPDDPGDPEGSGGPDGADERAG